jgi:hypothetical protein
MSEEDTNERMEAYLGGMIPNPREWFRPLFFGSRESYCLSRLPAMISRIPYEPLPSRRLVEARYHHGRLPGHFR